MSNSKIPEEILKRLNEKENIWFCSVRPSGRPHAVPVYFVAVNDQVYICTKSQSVKSKNIRKNPNVVINLEDGYNALIGEGIVTSYSTPVKGIIQQAFEDKYNWDISKDNGYDDLIAVKVNKWIGFKDKASNKK